MADAVPQEEELPAGTGTEGVSVRCHLHQHGRMPAGPAGLNRHEGVRLSAGSPKGKDAPSATKMSKLEALCPALMAKDKCQCSGPSTEGKEVGSVVAGGTGEGHDQASMKYAFCGVGIVAEAAGLARAVQTEFREDARPEQG